MTNKLAKQVRLLAELSGVKPYQHETNPARPDEWVWAYYDATEVNAKMLPAASGHVELSEVGLLETWLYKARYSPRWTYWEEPNEGYKSWLCQLPKYGELTEMGYGDTLEEALENAILALDLEKNDD